MTGNELPEFTFDLGEMPIQEEAVKEQPAEQSTEVTTAEQQPEAVQEPEKSTEQPVAQPAEQQPEASQEAPENADHYKALFNFYKDEGLIEYDGEFTGSKEQFAEILEAQRLQEREQIQNNIVEAMPEYAQTLVEYILTEGQDLTTAKLKEFLDISSQSSGLPDVSSEANAKAYLLEKFTQVHGNADIATKFVEALEDDGNLMEVAQQELEKQRADVQKAEQAQLDKAKQNKAAKKQQYQQFMNSLNSELEATSWKPEVRQAVFNEIATQELRNKTASIVNHPKALIKLANYLRFYDMEKGDIDESSFSSAAYSGAAKGLKDKIERHFNKSDAFGEGTATRSKPSTSEQFEFAD